METEVNEEPEKGRPKVAIVGTGGLACHAITSALMHQTDIDYCVINSEEVNKPNTTDYSLMMLAMATMSAQRDMRRRSPEPETVTAPAIERIPKGCRKFWYGEQYVIARDQKNADRKAKNKGWIRGEGDDEYVDWWISNQPEWTPEETQQRLNDLDECASFIQKSGISPNLDFPD